MCKRASAPGQRLLGPSRASSLDVQARQAGKGANYLECGPDGSGVADRLGPSHHPCHLDALLLDVLAMPLPHCLFSTNFRETCSLLVGTAALTVFIGSSLRRAARSPAGHPGAPGPYQPACGQGRRK